MKEGWYITHTAAHRRNRKMKVCLKTKCYGDFYINRHALSCTTKIETFGADFISAPNGIIYLSMGAEIDSALTGNGRN